MKFKYRTLLLFLTLIICAFTLGCKNNYFKTVDNADVIKPAQGIFSLKLIDEPTLTPAFTLDSNSEKQGFCRHFSTCVQ